MHSVRSSDWIISLLCLRGIGRRKALDVVLSNGDLVGDENLFEVLNENKEHLKIRELQKEQIDRAIEAKNKIVGNSFENEIKWVTIVEEDYPKKLREIPDPPVILYYKGNIRMANDIPGVAIIGTRNPTGHGMEVGKRLGFRFTSEGFNIVSGLAVGCDTAGHEGALEGSGKTTAVLAQPLDKIYPKENRQLADRILESNGLLLTEYPLGAKTGRSSFVERDRIQAGLSTATIVVETDVKGGTMHTVGFTLDYHRMLFAYFNDRKIGYLDNNQTKGNQMLIRENKAFPISSEEDILSIVRRIRLSDKVNNGSNSTGVPQILLEKQRTQGSNQLKIF